MGSHAHCVCHEAERKDSGAPLLQMAQLAHIRCRRHCATNFLAGISADNSGREACTPFLWSRLLHHVGHGGPHGPSRVTCKASPGHVAACRSRCPTQATANLLRMPLHSPSKGPPRSPANKLHEPVPADTVRVLHAPQQARAMHWRLRTCRPPTPTPSAPPFVLVHPPPLPVAVPTLLSRALVP